MTSGPDPALVEKLAGIHATAEQESAAISDEVEATKAQLAEESRQADEETKQRAQELDEQIEQRRAGKTGETDTNSPATSQASDPSGRQFGFEDDQEFQEEPVEHSAPGMPPRVRHRREPQTDIDEDEDFSKTSWLNG